ncbi:MAG: YbaB/EbfC family nucleoid-associated protein [Acidimicrobiales bacterium]
MSEQFDLGALLERAQAVQQQLVQARAEAAEQVVEGQAGGGVVRVKASGAGKLVSIGIDPEVVDRDDVGMLEDLVLAAANDALARAQELNQSLLGGVDLGGAGLPGL